MQDTKAHQVLCLSSPVENYSETDKKLCIEIGYNFYSFCISDRQGKDIFEFSSYETSSPVGVDHLRNLFDHPKINQSTFVDVVLIHNRRDYAMIPAPLHHSDVNATLLQTIHGDLEERVIYEDDVHQWELFTVYGWSPSIVECVAERFPQVRFIQFTTGALRSLFKSNAIEKEQVIKLYFYQKEMIAITLKESELQLAQTFHFETPQDVIYHLLNLVERLKLDLATVVLEVSGLIDMHSETWIELNKFFVDVQFDEPSNFSDSISQEDILPVHYYTPFLISPRCV